MELSHLKYFYEVAKAGSFSRAAQILRVSQPSLSKTVALLEDREGIKLLDRSKKGVTLTELGSEVFYRCEKMFGVYQEIEAVCREKEQVCHGPFRIGASDHIANYLLVSRLSSFVEKYPLVNPGVFVGTPHDMCDALLKNEIEFALFFTKIPLPSLVYESLIEVPLAAVAIPRKAKDKEFLMKSYIGSIQRAYKENPAKDWLMKLKESPQTHFEASSQEMQKRLCLAGCGWAILARFMVEKEIKEKKLEEIPFFKATTSSIYLVRKKNLSLSNNAKKFIEHAMNKDN